MAISRHQDRLRFPEKAGSKDQAYEFESLAFPAVQRLLNSYFAEFLAIAPEHPLGKRGGELMSWFFPTRAFRSMTGQDGGTAPPPG